MLVAAAVILILLIIVIGILVVPFHVYFNVYNTGFNVKGTFRLTWLKIKLIQKEIPPKKSEEKKEDEAESKFDISNILEIFSLLTESWPYLERVFNSFLRSTSFEIFSLDLIMGLGDPADTAMASGCFWAASSMLNLIPNAYISLEPDFLNERIEADVTLKFKVRLLWIVIELVRAFTKKPVRTLFKELINMRG